MPQLSKAIKLSVWCFFEKSRNVDQTEYTHSSSVNSVQYSILLQKGCCIMSFQPSIRLALLSLIAICGCSTGTSNIPVLSMNPFAAAPFGSTAKKPPTQYSLSLNSQPKQRTSALDWFRRSGSKAPSFALATPSPQAILNPQSIASHPAPMPVYSQTPNTVPTARTYQPPASAMQTAVRSPFVNPGNVAAVSAQPSNVNAQYSAIGSYVPSPHAPTQHAVTAPFTAPAQYSVPPQSTSYGVPMQPTQQYTSVPFPSTSAAAHSSVSAQYSPASQYNAPQYTQPVGFSGSTFR